MMIHEQEAEEALGKWSSSKYAALEGTSLQDEDILRGEDDLDRYFSHRITNASTNEKEQVDIDDYWKEDDFKLPGGYKDFTVISRAKLAYPVASFRSKIPDVANYSIDQGFEYGSGQEPYHIKFTTAFDDFTVQAANRNTSLSVKVDFARPADYDTAWHRYDYKLNQSTMEFYLDRVLRAVIVFGVGPREAGSTVVKQNTEPYSIGLFPSGFHSRAPLTFRNFSPEGPWTFTVGDPTGRGDGVVQYHPGSPYPPRTFNLYDDAASTLMTSGTYASGVSHKSHPIPIHGYDGKTLLFRADTDSVTDGLQIEVYTQAGNWRVYDTVTASANSLESYIITGDFPLVRVGYEPSADGASITDAEVTMK